MTKKLLVLLMAAAMIATSCDKIKNTKTVKLTTADDSASYILGAAWAMDFKSQDTAEVKMDKDVVIRGFIDAIAGRDITQEEAFKTFIANYDARHKEYQKGKMKIMYDQNIALGKEFLEKIKVTPGVVSLPSGLLYYVNKNGEGAQINKNNIVSFTYTVYTTDGQKRIQPGSPTVIKVADIDLPGLQEGLTLMRKGASYKFYMPSDLAYRDQLNVNVPLGSAVIMDVDVVDVIK